MRIQPIRYGTKIIVPARNVVSNMNFDGSLFDDAGNTWAEFNDFSGDISISSTRSKFGGSSLYCNGSGQQGTYIKTTSGVATSNVIGLRDFTLRLWFLVDSSYVQASPNRQIMGSIGANTQTVNIRHRHDGGSPFGAGNITMETRVGNGVSVNVPAKDTWYHLEIGRSGDIFYFFFDGALVHTANNAGFSTFIDTIALGAAGDSSFYQFLGYIDGFNVTMDECLHTASFTPPTAPYAPPYVDI